jgi:SAM-dependent methyltransferase
MGFTPVCVCGEERHSLALFPGNDIKEDGSHFNCLIPIAECKSCGIKRHADLPFCDDSGMSEYYKKKYPPTKRAYTYKTYDSDRELADKRLSTYALTKGARLLDVGSGSGAFVDACRDIGIDAYGCEIGEYSYCKTKEFTYLKPLNENNFPVDYFDIVTSHDVVEHQIFFVDHIKEIFRIVKQEGLAIIEMPRFFHESGKHHWRKTEHVWYLDTPQFIKIAQEVGFNVEKTTHPIESKNVFFLRKPVQKRTSILVPPGIGDSYWSLVKMQAFMRREKIDVADIFVACPRENTYNLHSRAFPFLEMFPFVHPTGVTRFVNDPAKRNIWDEAYKQKGRTVFNDICGCNFFLSYNGHISNGVELEDVDGLECNWDLPMFVSLRQEAARQRSESEYGKYAVCYFVFHGTYGHWLKEFPAQKIAQYLNSLQSKTGLKIVFVGAKWDAEDKTLNELKGMLSSRPVDLVGRTSVEELFGVMRGAEIVIGFPSGITIFSAALKIKTLILWNDYYNRDFHWTACPPASRLKNYFIENTYKLEPNYLADMTTDIIDGRNPGRPPGRMSEIMKRDLSTACIRGKNKRGK